MKTNTLITRTNACARSLCRALVLLPCLAISLALIPESANAIKPLSNTTQADLATRFSTIEDRILIRTSAAMYRFHPESESWMTLTSENGLPKTPLTNLCLTSDELWLTGTGAAVSDPKFDDWQLYSPGEGFPGKLIFNIESDDDYSYAATDAGAARFDRYVLEWEPLTAGADNPLGKSYDVAVGEDRVWFALETGIAQYRKSSESFRFDHTLDQLVNPRVIALRQTSTYLWAITSAGLARYDKNLETWTSYLPGVDLPDAQIHQATLVGEDIYLGTDDGLWSYTSNTGIWRQDQSSQKMPGQQVFAFSASGNLWVVTDKAFARYDEKNARWIDFTTNVPLSPGPGIDLAYMNQTLLLAGQSSLIYAVTGSESNPNLFQYRIKEIESLDTTDIARQDSWSLGLDEGGVGARRSQNEYLLVKGGTTIYIENDPGAAQEGESDYANLISDSRFDLTLNGKSAGGRAISGFYDTTDPDNDAYQVSFRGTREDNVRNISAGEINQQFFNSNISSDTGIEGFHLRTEFGDRNETTRRRHLAADVWAGARRTFPGHMVFYGEGPYRLGHRDLIAESEVIRIDQETLRRDDDYTIDWKSGSFILGTHIPISSDTAIEVNYQYEVENDSSIASDSNIPDDRDLFAGQVGFSATDNLFLGLGATSWTNDSNQRAGLLNLNTRFEHKTEDSFLRLTPEIAFSRLSAENEAATSGSNESDENEKSGTATGIKLSSRYKTLELTASHQHLAADLTTLTDRRTLLGRLREESKLSTRLDLSSNIQTTLEWQQKLSDQVPVETEGSGGGDITTSGHGSESLLLAGVRYLRHGFPNISLQRGQVQVDSLGTKQEKLITRAELELSPNPDKLKSLGIKRLWLRSFFERNERKSDGPTKITDHSYIRLNGSTGNPLSWNLYLENQWIHRPDDSIASGLRRVQDLNFTLQSIPHRVINFYATMEAGRDLSWLERGGSNGFTASRQLTSTTYLYPGRLHSFFLPLSLQIDFGKNDSEAGHAGEKLPGSNALWQTVSDASEQRDSHFSTIESRLQLRPWLKLVDRLESNTSNWREDTEKTDTRHRLFENRLEIRPRGGLLTIRFLDEKNDEKIVAGSSTGNDSQSETKKSRRLSTEWTQAWGKGWQSYTSFEIERSTDHHPLATHRWTPQIRLTYHHRRWNLNANLGLKYTYQESYDTSTETNPNIRSDSRTTIVTSDLDIRPLRILGLKVQHLLDCTRGKKWDHSLNIRIMIRA